LQRPQHYLKTGERRRCGVVVVDGDVFGGNVGHGDAEGPLGVLRRRRLLLEDHVREGVQLFGQAARGVLRVGRGKQISEAARTERRLSQTENAHNHYSNCTSSILRPWRKG